MICMYSLKARAYRPILSGQDLFEQIVLFKDFDEDPFDEVFKGESGVGFAHHFEKIY